MCRHALRTALVGFSCLFSTTFAQRLQGTNFTGWFKPEEFPDAQHANISALMKAAFERAQPDIFDSMAHRCIVDQVYPAIEDAVPSGFLKPFQAFDGVYFVGNNDWSSWAIDTREGIVLIDALLNADEARQVITPGLEAFGYEAADVKAILITHEHGDHYGGAKYFQDSFNTSVYANEVCWEGIVNADPELGPARDQYLTEEEPFVLSNLTVHSIFTPGHTPGANSMIFNVADNGVPLMAAVNGGAGINRNLTWRAEQIRSNYKLADAVEEHNVTVLLGNHVLQDRTTYNSYILEDRAERLRNPYAIGTDPYVRYLKSMSLCTQLQTARSGLTLPPFDEAPKLVPRGLASALTQKEHCVH